jgi:hypothetical protein
MLQVMFNEPQRGEETDHLRKLVQLGMELERARSWEVLPADPKTD